MSVMAVVVEFFCMMPYSTDCVRTGGGIFILGWCSMVTRSYITWAACVLCTSLFTAYC